MSATRDMLLEASLTVFANLDRAASLNIRNEVEVDDVVMASVGIATKLINQVTMIAGKADYLAGKFDDKGMASLLAAVKKCACADCIDFLRQVATKEARGKQN